MLAELASEEGNAFQTLKWQIANWPPTKTSI